MLKLFSKSANDLEEGSELIETPTREQRLELNLRDLGLEVLQLRQEINSMMIRQQAFKIALGQLRDHLEDQSAVDESALELQEPFQELLPEAEGLHSQSEASPSGRKTKSNLH